MLTGGKSDLAYKLAFEILPKIELADFKGIALERFAADVTEPEIEQALGLIAEQNRPFAARGEGGKVEKGDRVVIDFTGKIDGEPFEGGTGGDVGVNVGSGTFIPGFEDQLVGMAVGETRLVKVTFPAGYMSAALAGKDAEFDVTAKAIETPGTVTIDDAFAKSLGLESLDKLKEAVKARLQQEHAGQSRLKLKRMLLDKLDAMHQFALPPTLAEEEFKNVWTAVENDLKAQARTFADEGTTEEKARGISRHRRAPGAARPGAGRDRREEQHHGDRRRADARHQRTDSPHAGREQESLGTTTGRTLRPWRACARRSSRKKWSTSWSSWPR